MGRYRRFGAMTVCAIVAATIGTVVPAFAQAPPGTRIDLRVLVVTDGGPSTTAIAGELAAEGVPYRLVNLNDPDRPTIDADFLADVVDDGGTPVERAKYQAVVVPNDSALSNPAELAALTAYERRFGIRQVDAYVWPDASLGFAAPTYAGTLDGVTGSVTAAGSAGAFGYLRGPVPFEDTAPGIWESYGFLAQPLPADPAAGTALTPLVTAAAPDGSAGDVLIGDYTGDGRRRLALSFSYNGSQEQFKLLAPGIVAWATDGVHLGLHRNYFSVQVDDVFLPDSRWSTTGNCTPEEDCPATVTTPDIRMTPDDVAHAVAWQTQRQFTFDMVFNAAGSEEARSEGQGADPLTDALLAQRDQFRWTNHTYTHEFLGCLRDVSVVPWRCETEAATGDVRYTGRQVIEREITENLAWATAHDLAVDRTELVTGEHSGLKVLPQQPETNPELAPALDATGVTWLAADSSRMPTQVAVGPARTVPRYPLNVFFNVATVEEQTDEYNWIYTSRADGGSGVCEDHPDTVTCIEPLDVQSGFADYIIPLETRLTLGRVLGNDPRPHFVHQSNLAEDRLIYPILDSILDRYRALLADNTPIVCQRMSAGGAELRRQAAWAAAVRSGDAGGYLQDGRVVVHAPDGVDVPITVGEGSRVGDDVFGDAYAGARSAYLTPDGSNNGTVALP